jgi:arsenate reductase
MDKPNVAFICVHNSCRSQIAEALSKKFAADIFNSFSGGTETKPEINKDAVRLVKELYGIDMIGQKSKNISDLPKIDIVITMGCNVNCPILNCKLREDWGLDDPSGKNDKEFIKTIRLIENKVKNLSERIMKKMIL